MENNKTNNESQEKTDSFSLNDLLKACASKWRWFLISVILFTGLGVFYVITRQPQYNRTMQVLVKDQDGGGGMADIASQFSSLGLVSTNTNVYNELISLMSPAVMSEVVVRLGLDVDYLEKGFPHGTTLYGSTLPFVINVPDLDPKDAASFVIELEPDGTSTINKFVKYDAGGTHKFDKEVKLPAGANKVRTPVGTIVFSPNERYVKTVRDKTVKIAVTRQAFLPTVEKYTSMLKGDLTDRDADVIDLSMKDVSIERVDDILNSVLDVYTSNWVSDKNRMAVATSQFIDERLKVIEKELGVVDSEIMDYKSKTLVPDLEEAARLNMKSTRDMDSEILETGTELSLARYVYDFVRKSVNKYSVIPVNTGVVSGQLEVQITNYNTLLLNRNNVASATSASNPIVQDYDTQLAGMREAIERALYTQVVGLEKQLAGLEGAQGNLRGQLASAPNQAKYLLSVERQQKIKEELYLYLLQKREENELNQTFTADNTRVITPPTGPVKPIFPKKMMTVGLALLVGLLFPAVIIYMRESSNTKVRSRKDLERMTTPFIGEIPMVGGKNRFEKLRKLFGEKKKKKLEEVSARVSAGSRDLINESFRIVRGNIDFMMRSDTGRVMMVTSFNPGSGKSFVTYNLAATFAIKGKKVLVIDCDLRHGSASQFVGMPGKGISSYLTGNTQDWRSLVVKDKFDDMLYILPIGHRPPNPAELLESPLMKQLVDQARQEYDYIFLDCPPVDIVVDTQILAPLADRTIFIVRAGLLEKSAIPEIDDLYKNYRFKQMSILLNGTEHSFSRYGSDGRGYYGSAYQVKD